MNAHLRSWALALDGTVSGASISCPGPGHSRKDRSLSVTPSMAAGGFLVHSHCGDDWKACRDYVCTKLGIEPFAPRRASQAPIQLSPEAFAAIGAASSPPEATLEPNANANRARAIWRESIEIRGTLATDYLDSRGLFLDEGEDWHRVLRFHPSCPFGAERAPAMIALMRDIVTDEPRCVQRTRLTPDGRKIDRQMLGPAKGAAIKIDASAKVSATLSIGEGLETCMSGRVHGCSPAWAVGSAGAIGTFPVLARIERLNIHGENDPRGTNQHAILECATRWHASGREVVFAIWPDVGHKDLNDELRATPDAADPPSFVTAVQDLWPGAAILIEPEKLERANFQKELAELRAVNARIYGHCGQT